MQKPSPISTPMEQHNFKLHLRKTSPTSTPREQHNFKLHLRKIQAEMAATRNACCRHVAACSLVRDWFGMNHEPQSTMANMVHLLNAAFAPLPKTLRASRWRYAAGFGCGPAPAGTPRWLAPGAIAELFMPAAALLRAFGCGPAPAGTPRLRVPGAFADRSAPPDPLRDRERYQLHENLLFFRLQLKRPAVIP